MPCGDDNQGDDDQGDDRGDDGPGVPDEVIGCIILCMTGTAFEPNAALTCVVGCALAHN